MKLHQASPCNTYYVIRAMTCLRTFGNVIESENRVLVSIVRHHHRHYLFTCFVTIS